MVNLNDVAQKAHVSKMTVSRVINHPDQVSPELMRLVQQAIKAVGYVPNQVARALVNQRQYVVRFLLLEDVSTVEPNYAKLLIRLANNLQKKGYTLEISLDIMAETQSIDGIIVSGWRTEDLSKLQALDVPVTLYGAAPTKCPLSSVDVDNQAGIEKATEYMWRQGYRDIYYIGLALDLPFARQREAGYRAVMAKKRSCQRLSNRKPCSLSGHVSNELIAQFPITNSDCLRDRSYCTWCVTCGSACLSYSA